MAFLIDDQRARILGTALAILFSSLGVTCTEASQELRLPTSMDGMSYDWIEKWLVANDPEGDASAAFDVKGVWAKRAGNRLFVSFELASEIGLQNGANDEGNLKLLISGEGVGTLTISFRERKAFWNSPDERHETYGWSYLDFVCLPTHAAARYELQIDLTETALAAVDRLQLTFADSDSLDNPVDIPSDDRFLVEYEVSFDRPRATDLRIANLNTWKNGLANPERGPAIKRLVQAADADVYCFQEEWIEPEFNAGVNSIFGNDASSLWSGGCAIVSRLDLKPIPMKLDRAVCGTVTTEAGKSVVVISAHFKCCGYAGSSEDGLRIQQARQIAQEVKRLKEGAFGQEIKNAGVVLIGDYNLVGSHRPMEELAKAGLRIELLLKSPMDQAAHTWRALGDDETYWPGRLDLLTITNDFRDSRGLILDSSRLPAKVLNQLGLQADDSRASDHLMLIADFAIPSKTSEGQDQSRLDQSLPDRSVRPNLLEIIPVGNIRARLFALRPPDEVAALVSKMKEAVASNPEWLEAFMEEHSDIPLGNPLPYHRNLGITEEEYQRVINAKSAMELVPGEFAEIKVERSLGDKMVFEGIGSTSGLSGLQIDLKTMKLSYKGIVSDSWSVDRPENRQLVPADGITWSSQQGSIAGANGMELSLTIGKQLSNGNGLLMFDCFHKVDGQTKIQERIYVEWDSQTHSTESGKE